MIALSTYRHVSRISTKSIIECHLTSQYNLCIFSVFFDLQFFLTDYVFVIQVGIKVYTQNNTYLVLIIV